MAARSEVLVVDDDRFVRDVVSRLLRREGLAVREAAGGPEAVEAYREHRGSLGAVLMDVLMPGLDGPQTLALLRGIDPDVRCCFLTGSSGLYSEGELLALGAKHVFDKPVRDFARLARTLAEVMAEPSPAHAGI